MTTLNIKCLTVENWHEPDSTSTGFAQRRPDGEFEPMTGDDWARAILRPTLLDSIPSDIQDLYAVARGTMVYGWFFYPLYTLGLQQLSRVAETAVSHKYAELSGPQSQASFAQKIQWLLNQGILPADQGDRWDALRRLRNSFSHPEYLALLTPGHSLTMVEWITDQINALFRVP
jgi:hypothetical protein